MHIDQRKELLWRAAPLLLAAVLFTAFASPASALFGRGIIDDKQMGRLCSKPAPAAGRAQSSTSSFPT